MRVIAGTRRSLPLKTLPGLDTRPTADRVKETLFNMMQVWVPESRFLDLFAGSGAIGIEALSRGAAFACFADSSRKAVRVIEDNLAFTRFTEQARVLAMDAEAALAVLDRETPFDIVFMDPPYRQDLERTIFERLRTAQCVHPETLYIVEAALETDLDYLEELGYACVKSRHYKTSKHLFLKRIGD